MFSDNLDNRENRDFILVEGLEGVEGDISWKRLMSKDFNIGDYLEKPQGFTDCSFNEENVDDEDNSFSEIS